MQKRIAYPEATPGLRYLFQPVRSPAMADLFKITCAMDEMNTAIRNNR
jgi:hypothetical protein